LLRSDNGGKSWQEVMMPGYGGGVMFLTFKENFGLAVSAWTIEAFGPLQIFGTTDLCLGNYTLRERLMGVWRQVPIAKRESLSKIGYL
jgi:hypothetical protein